MPIDITIPSAGESVTSGVINRWLKNTGDFVKRDEIIIEVETDKVTLEIPSPAAGVLKQTAKPGDTVAIGAVIGTVDEKAAAPTPPAAAAPAGAPNAAASAPAKSQTPVLAAAGAPSAAANGHASTSNPREEVRATPLARKLAGEQGVDLKGLQPSWPDRIRAQDVAAAGTPAKPAATAGTAAATPRPAAPAGAITRERLSPLRQRIAQRLVEAQHTAAMLTTFNEVDMTSVMALRTRYKEEFEKRHAVGLGFMSFFVKSVVSALKSFPLVNAQLVRNAAGELEVEKNAAAHIAVAVSTPKGLTVPVLRDAGDLSFAEIEKGIKELATKARDNKLALDDLQGGTFTITNGGVFGSLLSTPILNAPQSAILGMHTIKNRPVEHPDKPGEIALRPMMYLALSYDHRLLDGSEAVQFLVAVKSGLERPERLMMGL
ncbi:2-oxoglutarate dehydrogenase complex dihydrolipoyllysine-residue succinyltransferase [soil metagenome]